MSERKFAATHIDQDCTAVTGDHENELFFNCKFDKVTGLQLKDCDLSHSQFITNDIKDALGLTVTLNCHSFRNIVLSPLMFDLLLCLLLKTKGNDAKRRMLVDVIGQDRLFELLKEMSRLEG